MIKNNLRHILKRKKHIETHGQDMTVDDVVKEVYLGSQRYGYKEAKRRISEGKPVIPKKKSFIYENE